MKILIAYPTNGTNKTYEIKSEDEKKFINLEINQQFDGKLISSELEGSIIQITGGSDKCGFCMVSRKATPDRFEIFFKSKNVGFRPKHPNDRRKKTVRGSMVSFETSVINAILVRPKMEGDNEVVITGLTDIFKPNSHMPKKAYKLRKMFGLDENEVNIKEKIFEIIRENNPDAQLPKIKRITGIISEKEKKTRLQKLAFRQARKDKFLQSKKEYEAKFGKVVVE